MAPRRPRFLRLRLAILVGIVSFSVVTILPMFRIYEVHDALREYAGIYVPAKRLRLGMDLTGGHEIVYQVKAGGRYPVSAERTTDAVMDRLDEATSVFNCGMPWEYQRVARDTIRIHTPEEFDRDWLESFRRISGDYREIR